MSCKYKDQCPSYSGWCKGPKQDFSRCVEFLVTAYEHDKMLSDDKLEKAIKAVSAMDVKSGVSQSVYVIEECSELIKELTKQQRGRSSEKDILAEACDVLTTVFVLLSQYEEYIMTKEEQVIETIRKGPGMSPNEYQRLALRTASEESMKDPLLNGLLGLGGKTGECQDLYKKHRFQGHELDKAKMAKELGDVSWYLALTAYAIGYNLEDIFKMNIEKLRARYPDGFDADHSLHRRPGDI